MASLSTMNSSFKTSFMFLSIFFVLFFHGISTEFEVGETKGWEVPPSKDPQVYNEWAQKNRFKVNDTLQFKYKKDSVMAVTEGEYEKCRSSKPIFFSNNGDTEFVLDKAGLFYFISGVTGHCERGQKMIVKVLEVNNSPDDDHQPRDGNLDHNGNKKNGATQLKLVGVTNLSSVIMALVVILVFLIMA